MYSLTHSQGLFVVAQTPFDSEGEVDLESIDTMTDFYFRHGAVGLTVLGVAGEAAKLTTAEAIAVADRYIRRAGGRPVVVGVSSSSGAMANPSLHPTRYSGLRPLPRAGELKR